MDLTPFVVNTKIDDSKDKRIKFLTETVDKHLMWMDSRIDMLFQLNTNNQLHYDSTGILIAIKDGDFDHFELKWINIIDLNTFGEDEQLIKSKIANNTVVIGFISDNYTVFYSIDLEDISTLLFKKNF
jgi:hypothetical protein